MQTSRGDLEYQEWLWLLGSLCNLYRISFDPKLIEQAFPPPHSLATFHEAASALGFKTGQGPHPAEWQALAIARALLKRPKILVFDEAVQNRTDQTTRSYRS